MREPLLLSSEAEQDIDEAFLWYEIQSPGLGNKFISCVDEGFEYIAKHPEAFPILYRGLRKHILKKFPFNIYYRTNKNRETEIIRVLHQKRRQRIKGN
jgi:plasmid stabilization system protein ParE